MTTSGKTGTKPTVSTAAVADALDRAAIRNAVIVGLRPVIAGARIAGPAATLRLTASTAEKPGVVRHVQLLERIVNAEDIIVIDCNGYVDSAAWGGNLTCRAAKKGVRGVVIDGAARDVEEIRKSGLAVFARGLSPIGSSTHLETVGINEPVCLGGVQIRPGDMIVADDDGVVAVPREKAERVFELAEVKERADAIVRDEIDAGKSLDEAIAKAYRLAGW